MPFGTQGRSLSVGNRRVAQVAGTAGRNEILRGGNRLPFGDEESVCRDAQRGMVVKTTPSAPLEMAEPDLLLELLIIALDAPAQFGDVDEAAEGDVVWQGREPIFGGLVLALGPFDQQPFFRPRFSQPIIAMRRANTHASKPRGQPHGRALPPFDRAPGAWS